MILKAVQYSVVVYMTSSGKGELSTWIQVFFNNNFVVVVCLKIYNTEFFKLLGNVILSKKTFQVLGVWSITSAEVLNLSVVYCRP